MRFVVDFARGKRIFLLYEKKSTECSIFLNDKRYLFNQQSWLPRGAILIAEGKINFNIFLLEIINSKIIVVVTLKYMESVE